MKKSIIFAIVTATTIGSAFADDTCTKCVNAVDQKLKPRFDQITAEINGLKATVQQVQTKLNAVADRSSFFVLDLEQIKTGSDTLSVDQIKIKCGGQLDGSSTGIFQCEATGRSPFNCEGATDGKAVTVAAYVVSGVNRIRGLVCLSK